MVDVVKHLPLEDSLCLDPLRGHETMLSYLTQCRDYLS